MKNSPIQKHISSHDCNSKHCSTCLVNNGQSGFSRRQFLSSAIGVATAAAFTQFDSFCFAARIRSEIPKLTGGPRVKVVFIRPDREPDVSWPGGNCDVPAQQALFIKTLEGAAKELNVQLDLRAEPLNKPADVTAFLEQLKQSPPDGLIICGMSLMIWPTIKEVIEKRGDIPTILYSHLSGFTSHLQLGRDLSKTYVAATPNVQWLATGVRMFAAQWRIKNSRILLITKAGTDIVLKPWGTTLRRMDKAQFQEEFKKVEESSEIRAIAKAYTRSAKRIVEPTKEDILNAAKNYIVIRHLLETEQCNGVCIDCLGWKNPVCMAYSKLLDEGVPSACEGDLNATVGELLSIHLLNRSGFIQDPSPNTVDNTFIGSHCTCPTRLDGFDKDQRADFWLRSYHTRTGCSMQVLWPVGREVTVLQTSANVPSMLVGTGRVRSNIPQPPSGCCRTAVEIEMDNVVDTRNVKGFHQLFLLGNHERTLQAYGRLFDIKVERIA